MRNFSRVSVDPVGNVQGTVCAEGEEIVGSDCLGLAGSLQHEELGEDGDGFKPDGESPKDLCQRSAVRSPCPDAADTHLCEGVFVRKQYRQYRAGSDEILHLEGIEIGVVGGLVVVEHQVNGVRGSADEDDLENGIVERLGLVEGPEKIDVARNVYDEVEELRLERDAGCALLRLDGAVCGRQGSWAYARRFHLLQQDQNGQQMGKIRWRLRVSMRSLSINCPTRRPLRRVGHCGRWARRTE